MPDSERWTDDDTCVGCGHHESKHRPDPATGRLKCPVLRQESTTPPQERATTPRGDY